jgi:hypothetical protein
VTIDDRLPLDKQLTLLLPRTSIAGELWSLLLAKAMCVVLATRYETGPLCLEFGEASIIQMLTGWIPCRFSLDLTKYLLPHFF